MVKTLIGIAAVAVSAVAWAAAPEQPRYASNSGYFQPVAEHGDWARVVNIDVVQNSHRASGGGALLGGIAGGVLGHQIGSGRGNTAATIVGAGAGAYAGNEVEKNRKSTTSYQVLIAMDDGKSRTFNFSSPTSYKAGDKVKIVDGKITRQ
jgi:outer membrane lipoprotein SlyB